VLETLRVDTLPESFGSDMKKPTDTALLRTIHAKMLEWFDANARKNKAQKDERDSCSALEKLIVQNDKSTITLAIDNHSQIVAGYMNEESEEIDPKKFFEMHPDKFWDLVNIPKGAAVEAVGTKDVAKCSRPVKKYAFKVKKEKVNSP
jgi:hypothetical protein